MWVARDEDGVLHLFKEKPFRFMKSYPGIWDTNDVPEHKMILDSSLFPNVTWNSGPLEVEMSAKGCIDNLIDINIKSFKEIEELKKYIDSHSDIVPLHIENNNGTINII